MKFKVIIMTSLLLSGVCWFLIINSIANRLYTRNLIEAIDESNYDRLEELLDKNGNIDAKPYNNFHAFFLEIFNDPPLFYAIRKGDTRTVEMLLEHGADVNIESDDQKPIMVAARSLNVERFAIAQLLIDYGADINYADKWGVAPVLSFSLSHNSKDDYDLGYDLFLRFVSLGVIPESIQEFTYGNFLLYAVTTNNVLIVDYLINVLDYDIHTTGKDGVSALIRASQYHSTLVVEYLLERDVDISYKDDFNKSAYDYALEKDYTDIMILLKP
jgi:ankyrin repeat protein